MNDRKGLGLFAGMQAGIGAEEGMDGIFSVRAEGEAIVVDIEVDVLAHDGLVHFLGVDFYKSGRAG